MDLQANWEKALKFTEILRARVKPLETRTATHLPYIFLAESAVNPGDSIVRKGEIMVEKPSIILPSHSPQFEGFQFEEDLSLHENSIVTFLMVRGIKFPSMKYNNKTSSVDVFEGRLERAIGNYRDRLQKEEDTGTGLVTGPEDCWQFSILIFICHQILRQADGDIRKLLDDYRRGNL